MSARCPPQCKQLPHFVLHLGPASSSPPRARAPGGVAGRAGGAHARRALGSARPRRADPDPARSAPPPPARRPRSAVSAPALGGARLSPALLGARVRGRCGAGISPQLGSRPRPPPPGPRPCRPSSAWWSATGECKARRRPAARWGRPRGRGPGRGGVASGWGPARRPRCPPRRPRAPRSRAGWGGVAWGGAGSQPRVLRPPARPT